MKERTHIAVHPSLKTKIEALAARMLKAYQRGRSKRVRPVVQGSRGTWVALEDVIELAIDEMIAHMDRGAKRRTPVNADELFEASVSPEAFKEEQSRLDQINLTSRCLLEAIEMLKKNDHIGEGSQSPINLVEADIA